MGQILTPIERLTQDSTNSVSSPAAETAILTTTFTQSSRAGAPNVNGYVNPVKINVAMNVTPGTGATALGLRVRQGVGTGGPVLIGVQNVACTAGNNVQMSFQQRDFSGFLQNGGQYTVTLQETGASVAGTVNDIDVVVEN